MKRNAWVSAWSVRNWRRILIVVILIVVLTLVLQRVQLEMTRNRLFQSPEPRPKYISAIAPFPGSIYPTDQYSRPYWGEVDDSDGICVRLDARAMLPPGILSNTELAFEQIPLDSVDLYLNNELVSPYSWTDEVGNLRLSKIKRGGFPSTIKNPTGPKDQYLDHVPINFCWRTNLAPGFYLAELVIHSKKPETLTYQWAFRVVE